MTLSELPMPARKPEDRQVRAKKINAKLKKLYPDAQCALVHDSPLQLLIATILSAQCTDVQVNKITPALFRRYPTARDFAAAELPELETLIHSTGFYRNKAKNISGCCQRLIEHHAGKVPNTMEELLLLPGVARKTANVVLGNAFDIPGLVVDTHVGRLARRMGLTRHDDPVKVETDLCEVLPAKDWTNFSHCMILHGRQVCSARKPNCDDCDLRSLCPQIGIENP